MKTPTFHLMGLCAALLFGQTLQPAGVPRLSKEMLEQISGPMPRRRRRLGRCRITEAWRSWYVARSRPAGTDLGNGYFVRFDGSLGNARKSFKRERRRRSRVEVLPR